MVHEADLLTGTDDIARVILLSPAPLGGGRKDIGVQALSYYLVIFTNRAYLGSPTSGGRS